MPSQPQSDVLPSLSTSRCNWGFRRLAGALLTHARTSLVFQWTLTVVLLVALAISLFGWIAVDRQKATYASQTDRFGRDMAAQLAGSAGEPLLAEDWLALEVMLNQVVRQERVLGAAVVGRGREPVGEGLQAPYPSTAAVAGEESFAWQWRDADGSVRDARSYRAPVQFADLEVGHAIITLDASVLTEGLRLALRDITIAALLLIPGAVAAGVLLTRRVSRPLRTLSHIGRSLDADDTLELPPVGGQVEIDRVMEVFLRLSRGIQEKKRLESLFQRYVPVTGLLLEDPSQPVLHGKIVEGTVLFGDVCGFTALSENLPPEQVVELLNAYFRHITVAAHSCGGVVDSFSGDGVMIVFGGGATDPNHALHATTCALLIQEAVRRINRERADRESFPVWFRIGVNSGTMAQCNLGGAERMQHTVIGDTVNVAYRLCGIGDPGEITIGESTAEHPDVASRFRITRQPRQPVHGRNHQVVPYRVESLLPSHQAKLTQMLDRILLDPTA